VSFSTAYSFQAGFKVFNEDAEEYLCHQCNSIDSTGCQLKAFLVPLLSFACAGAWGPTITRMLKRISAQLLGNLRTYSRLESAFKPCRVAARAERYPWPGPAMTRSRTALPTIARRLGCTVSASQECLAPTVLFTPRAAAIGLLVPRFIPDSVSRRKT
jgi:hypothetical protein